MAFDLKTWQHSLKTRLKGWKQTMQDSGVYSVYGFLATWTVWPVVQAYAQGDLAAIAALGNVLSGVGGGLLANRINTWKDKADETELAKQIAQEAESDPKLRAELDALLEKLDSLSLAREALPKADQQWFADTLHAELTKLGNLQKFEAVITGSVIVTDSPGAVIAGPGGTAIGTMHGNVYTGPEAKDPQEALRIYRRVLVAACRHLPLRGIDIGASDPTGEQQRLDLARVYINLDTKSRIQKDDAARRRDRASPHSQEDQPLTVLEATIDNRRLVILGDPGSGKSTFCNYLSVCLAAHGSEPQNEWLERLPGWPANEADLLPLPVVLRDFAAWLPQRIKKAEPRHLWDFIVHRLESQNLGFTAAPVHDCLERGKALVLVDGLDEIPTGKQRTLVRDAVAAFAERYADSRMVVTCRTLSYQDKGWQLGDFPWFELAPFDDNKISRFIDAWYAELARLGQVKMAEAGILAERLRQALQQRPDLQRLAPNPLLLTVMALVHTHKGRLPDARALLYEETVDILLWRWEQVKASGEAEAPRLRQLLNEAGRTDVDLKRKLWHLAFEAHQRGGTAEKETLADIGELQLQKKLAELHPAQDREWAHQVIEAMKLRAGLLLERKPETYTFPHRTFQEYLAGAHLATLADFSKQTAKLLAEGPFWREVILLAAGRLVYLSGDTDRPLALAAELCPQKGSDSDLVWRKAWLAGEVLLEIGRNRVDDSTLGQELSERIRQRLTQFVRGSKLSPVERAAAGNVLARLGDPRFREDAWFLPDEELLGFVEIPAGSFKMGSDKKHDREAMDREVPQHELSLPTYYISRYPVTVAQFQAFVNDSGHKPAHSKSVQGVTNHPVVYVTWHEALKYCNWLTEKLRQRDDLPKPLGRLLQEENWRVTLPSEAEWEKAARGQDGRIFPWGDESDPNKANYDETGIAGASPVGCFATGESPFHCQDMAGNVWEWTRSLWHDYPYPADAKGRKEREDLKASGRRVVRGGAFNDFHRYVRCAGRYRDIPDYRYGFTGFRVVLRPFL